MKTKIFASLKPVITVLLFFVIFRNIDFAAFGSTLRNASVAILLAGFLTLWIGHFSCVVRWRMLMRPLMPVPSLRRLFFIYCMGMFFNLAFPTLVGGDAVKIYYTGRPSNSYAQSFAATFLDRDTGLGAMLAIACLSTVLHPIPVPGVPVSMIVWGVFFAFAAGNLILFLPGLHGWVSKTLRRIRLAGTAGKIDTVSEVLQTMARHKTVLAGAIAISFFNQFLYILLVWFVSEGLRLDIPFSYFLTFVPVITIITMVPVSLNGMGLREFAFMSLFGAVNVPPASCIALGLVVSFIIMLASLPGGFVYILYKNRGISDKFESLETEFS
jgi:uncharacterized protein (TIRG00374 family)